MTDRERIEFACGVSAVLPDTWQYSANSSGDGLTKGISLTHGSTHANLELLNRHDLSVESFISEYRHLLMNELAQLNVEFENPPQKFPNEISGKVISGGGIITHILLPSDPVAHINAVTHDEDDLVEVRTIASSLIIESKAFLSSNDDLLAMKLTERWQAVSEQQ